MGSWLYLMGEIDRLVLRRGAWPHGIYPIVARRDADEGCIMKTRSSSRKTSKRQLINTGKDKRYVRRRRSGQFKKSVKVGRSLAADRRSKARTKVKAGQGDRGDVM
jgi:hypothetical protein